MAPQEKHMKNFEIIGFKLERSVDEILARWKEDKEKLLDKGSRNGYSRQLPRESLVNGCAGYAVLRHLFSDVLEDDDSIRLGVSLGIDYFHTDWWKDNENDRFYMDRSNPEGLMWGSVLRDGLFCACLLQDWDAAAKLASWFDDDLVSGILGAGMADDLDGITLSVAARTSDSAPFDAQPVAAAIRSGGRKRSKSLLECLEAIDRGEQDVFGKSLNTALQTFIKQDQENMPNVEFWVDIESSIVAALAQRRGFHIPELSPKRQAVLVTRESAKLD